MDTNEIKVKVFPIKDAKERINKAKDAWKDYISGMEDAVYNAVKSEISDIDADDISNLEIKVDLGTEHVQDKFTALSYVLEAYRKEGYRVNIKKARPVVDLDNNMQKYVTIAIRIPSIINEVDDPINIIPEPTFLNKKIELKEDNYQ